MTTIDQGGTAAVDLFTPGEHAILSKYLGVLPPNTDMALPRLSEALTPFRLPKLYSFTPCAVAAATIVLERIQARLPNWSRMTPEGIVYGREERTTHVERNVLLTPVPLFQINWASTAPGLDWPTAYHCTYVPLYDRYVVTQSVDTTDTFGVLDMALGSFTRDQDFETACLEIIGKDWAVQAGNGSARYEELTRTGRIGALAINALADEIWPVWTDKEEDDAAEDGAD